jgi:type I restriction enzyme S subunit
MNGERVLTLEKTCAGRPFIATKDVGYGLDPIAYDNGLLVSTSDESFKVARAYSVLICAEGGSAGRKIGITDREICFGNKLLANETWSVVLPRYILFVYQCPSFYEQFAKQMSGIIGGISINKFLQLPVPLPPFAEQQRIVAKVDELMALCDRLEAARAGREAVRDRLTAATWACLTAPETDAEAFPTHARLALKTLPTLTTRPDQTKTLRQTILNLAVRGKLVEQYPTDEPAAELLKATLGKKSALPKVVEEPFEVPHAWMWVDFEDVAAFENGDRGKNYPNRNEYKEAGIPWINTGHIQPDGSLSATAMHFISREKFNALGGGKIRPGDMLYCLRGATFGKTAFVEPYEEGAIASSLMIIRPSKAVDRRFVYYYLTSPFGRSQLMRFDNGTAQPNLSSGNVKRYRFPLPPLAEQHRIVAKVEALMALCDQLEASLTTATATRSRLLDALLHEALGGQTEAAA